MNIIITGATGFVGSQLINYFDKSSVTLFSRKSIKNHQTINASLEMLLDKKFINKQFDVAIHLAGLAHKSYSLAEFRKINVDSTVALARQLAENGLKRFIFVSSIGVNGNRTEGEPFNELSVVGPHADYAVSKYEAELELAKLSDEFGFELVIIRPPLVYGKNAPGNFKRLYNLAKKGMPLPFGLANNSRSFISVGNLCDLIVLCVTHPKAANELFLASDDVYVSTREIIETIWHAENISSILIQIPVFIFIFIFKIFDRSSLGIQLFDDLEVDNSKAKTLLGWSPKQNMIDVFKNNNH
jgi:nucleoside-diphosphate-sugar epimerase